MIGKLTGVLDSLGEECALIDVGGVGYEVYCSARTLARLPEPGGAVSLYVETVLRQDFLRLYGFQRLYEKHWFVHLQSVQGVGARVALAILDVLEPAALQQAVAMQDKSAFVRAAGVGPKLAARLVAELKDRPPPSPPLASLEAGAYTRPTSGDAPAPVRTEGLKDILLRNDAISALVNLGYNEVRAGQAVAAAYARFSEDPPVDVLIKEALKELAQ